MYYNKSPKVEVRRRPDRAAYDEATITAILDEGFLCHVGLLAGDRPIVIPMIYGRCGDVLYLHGSPASRLLKQIPKQATTCVTVSIVDGLVLAKSARKHSVNYRSVVAFGTARTITDPREQRHALNEIVDHLLPGRSSEARPPTPGELSTTRVLAFTIEEASAKTRAGPPLDDEADLQLPIWAGELPLRLSPGTPRAEPASSGVPLAGALKTYLQTARC